MKAKQCSSFIVFIILIKNKYLLKFYFWPNEFKGSLERFRPPHLTFDSALRNAKHSVRNDKLKNTKTGALATIKSEYQTNMESKEENEQEKQEKQIKKICIMNLIWLIHHYSNKIYKIRICFFINLNNQNINKW